MNREIYFYTSDRYKENKEHIKHNVIIFNTDIN